MNLLKTTFPLLLLTLLGGCIKEDMSNCPPEFNTELTFSYTGDEGNPALFAQVFNQVTLFVFNATDGQLIAENTQVIDKASLTAFQGARLSLDAGKYTIICWGNATNENTEFAQNQTLATGRVHHPNYSKGTAIPTNDHLYYGEYNITVTTAGKVSGEIPFKGAHINMEVFVSGFSTQGNAASQPIIECHNLMPQYDLKMNATQPFGTTYYPTVGYDTENKVDAALFQTLRFGDDNTIRIVVKNKAGETKHTVNLKEYMLTNTIKVDNKNEATVRILIEFSDLGVTVTVPKWNDNDVEGGTD